MHFNLLNETNKYYWFILRDTGILFFCYLFLLQFIVIHLICTITFTHCCFCSINDSVKEVKKRTVTPKCYKNSFWFPESTNQMLWEKFNGAVINKTRNTFVVRNFSITLIVYFNLDIYFLVFISLRLCNWKEDGLHILNIFFFFWKLNQVFII